MQNEKRAESKATKAWLAQATHVRFFYFSCFRYKLLEITKLLCLETTKKKIIIYGLTYLPVDQFDRA